MQISEFINTLLVSERHFNNMERPQPSGSEANAKSHSRGD